MRRLAWSWDFGRSSASGSAAFGCVLGCMSGCVSADAGYAEVRDLTAARLRQDVRWYEHDSASAGAERTERLLAEPLTAEAAIQIALLNNQGLQADFEELGIARGRLVQALRLPNPSADVALRYSPGQDAPGIDVDVLIDLTDLLFLPLQGRAASAAMGAARASVTGKVLDLAYETRVAFYAYQGAEQTLELRRTILAALSAALEIAERLHEAGNITDLSLVNERALYEEARVAQADAEANVLALREELNARMGLWGERGAEWSASARLPAPAEEEPNLEGLERQALQSSLDLALHERRFLAAARAASLRSVAGWIPELNAGVSAEREAGESEWSFGPAVALEVPLFYQGQGEAGAAAAEARREQRLYAEVAVRIRSAARRAAARLRAAYKSASYYKAVLLPLRQRIVDETQLQFNAMSVSAFQLLQAKRDQIETARGYVDVLRSYWTARAEVDQLLAGRLPAAAPAIPAGERAAGPSGASSAAPH